MSVRSRHLAPAAAASAANAESRLAPSVVEILRFLRERPGDKRPVAELALAAARARTRSTWAEFWNEYPPGVKVIRNASVATSAGSVAVRVYDPETSGDLPIFYLHGGGFVVGDLDTHDGIARRIALLAGRPVISVAYRRAPEHPYPAPLDDCVGVVRAIAAGKADVGVDARRFALCGDSAGASLALGAALRLRDEGGPSPAALALLFGCFDPGMKTASIERFGGGEYMLTAADVLWFWRQYLGESIVSAPVYAAPLAADLAGLPPVFVAAAGLDPLRDESVALAARLKACGVPHALRVWEGMIHGCVGMGRMLNQADHQLAETAIWLSDALTAPTTRASGRELS